MINIIPVVFGLIIGSFVNVLIFRLPSNASIVRPASHCLVCQNKLKWWLNIPVLSFIILRGKCSFCSHKISLQYPLIELACAGIFILIFDISRPFITAGLCLSFSFLLAIAVIDLRHFIIHHSLLAAAFICLLPTVLRPGFIWQYHVAGMIFCPGFIWLVSQSVKLMNKRDNLGGGDVLLGIVIGVYLGPYLSMLMYSLASILGIGYWLLASKAKEAGKDSVPIPFGTGMVTGMLVLEILLLPPFVSSFKFLEIIVFTDQFVAEMLSLL